MGLLQELPGGLKVAAVAINQAESVENFRGQVVMSATQIQRFMQGGESLIEPAFDGGEYDDLVSALHAGR